MTNVKLVVAYDGSEFRGLAPNLDVRTVVGELERVIEPLIGREPNIVMSGRTDAGVHAWGQVLSFKMPDGAVDLARIQRSINSRLGPEVVAREVTEVDEEFSARYSATGRRYRYDVVNRNVPDPFLARTSWWYPTPLDIDAMNRASEHLIGTHDFTSFCRRPRPGPDADGNVIEPLMVRQVRSAGWQDLGNDVLRFEIEGSAFCHQMVRSIVGFMIMIGNGKRRVDDLATVLAARDRAIAEPLAPPNGLTLWQVDYD